VTRIARVTGLDRTGVEVACAVRPDGHVLQVSNGKGDTFAEAARGALSEAAELWAAEHPPPVLWGSEAEVRAAGGGGGRGAEVWGPAHLGEEPRLPPSVRTGWVEATVLSGRGRTVLVPASLVYCPPPEGPPVGPAVTTWTSNGLAAHPGEAGARVHALLEACERHLLALALPEGFTPEAVRRFRLAPEALAARAPGLARRVEALRARGFSVELFGLTPPPGRGRVALPLAAALLFDEEEGPHPVTAGYACRPVLEGALESALLEAAQSRLTDIHGAREDIGPPDREGARLLREMCREAARARRPARAPASRGASASRTAPEGADLRGGRVLPALLARLAEAGFPDVAMVRLTGEEAGLCVVKALVPGFLRSELL
jgi:ribosomal protein S12 methylthiotransferase accessory factor